MTLTKIRLGDYIELSEEKNTNLQYGIDDVKGISIKKVFIETKADMRGVNLRPYLLVKKDFFCYVSVTSRNGETITITLNMTDNTYIVSSSYVVFYIKDKNIIDPKSLFMIFNRSEFDRYSRFHSWGSARETFSFDEMCDIEIDLPSIDIQKKYVAIYEGLLANLHSYERGLDDLKIVCDGYIEDLRKKMPSEKIDKYLTEKNDKADGSIDLFQGVDVNLVFTEPKRIAEDKESGKIVRNNEIAFNKVMKANCTKLPIALRKGPDCIVSGSYTVFKIDETKLIPDYLMLWLSRSETQRWAGFVSYGTTRDIFPFDTLCEYKVPVPELKIQKEIVAIFNSLKKRKEYYQHLKNRVSTICPILIRGAILESQGGK